MSASLTAKIKFPRRLAAVVVAAALSHPAVGALQLGAASVQSRQGEPLKAVVQVRADTPTLTSDLTARLASAKEFARAGLDRPPGLQDIQFVWQHRDALGGRLVLTSRERPVGGPIQLVVEIANANTREIHRLSLEPGPPAPVPTVQRPRPKPAAAPRAATPAEGHLQVRPGDSLWKIAAMLRKDRRMSIRSIMTELHANNPQAFVNGDLNRLKTGATLLIPGHRNAGTAKPQPKPLPQKKPTPADQARLRIVTAAAGDKKKAAAATLHPVAQALQNQIEGYRQENQLVEEQNRELRSKLDLLREQITLMREQILAQAEYEKLLAEKAVQAAAAAAAQSAATAPGAQALVTSETKPENTDAAGTPAPGPVAAPTPTAQKPAPQPPAPALKGWGWPGLAYAALAALLVLGVGLLLLLRSRRGDEDSMFTIERDLIESSKVPRTDIEEVLSQVDVFLAHRQVAVAEKQLQKAIERYPFDSMLMYKLIEIYATTGNEAKFVKLVEEVQETLQRDAPQAWRKVEKFGRELVPYHPLFLSSNGPQHLGNTAAVPHP